ncbi:MAG: hypothetical protein ACR2HX_07330, partial [Pyrinomonadaceae bacterium]
MKKFFFGSFFVLVLMLVTFVTSYAQGDANAKTPNGPPATATAAGPAITATTSPIDLARAALAAQGGDKFKSLKSMVLKGSVDLYAPNSTQSVPGGF